MDTPLLSKLTQKEQILINWCHLYLQVECLSDISSADGTSILNDWKQANEYKPSWSTKSRPLQGNPGDEAWKMWRSFLDEHFSQMVNFRNVSVHGNSSTLDALSTPVINHQRKCYGIISTTLNGQYTNWFEVTTDQWFSRTNMSHLSHILQKTAHLST
jgi:hypothetical protein